MYRYRHLNMMLCFLVLLTLFYTTPQAAFAAGVVGNGAPASCTEAALTTALFGGGPVTFNCGGPATILILTQKEITQDTTIDGGGVITITGGLATRLFLVNAGATLTLRNIVLDSGFSVGGDGGAILNNGTLVLENSTIQFSKAGANHSGGAIYTTGPVTITKSTLKNNFAGSGGAIYNENGVLTINEVNLTDNKAPKDMIAIGYGGAIANLGKMTLTDSFFSQNEGRFGGALFVGGGAGNGQATLEHVYFSKNTAGSLGGALYTNVQTTTVTVDDSVFNNNTANNGGGVARFSAQLRITNSSLTNNTATGGGGGLYVATGPQPLIGGYVKLQSVTISSNKATNNQGGGVYNFAGGLELYSTTIVSNTQGVYSAGGGNTRFRSSVLHNPGFLNCDGDGTPISDDARNFATDTSCPLPSSQTGAGLNPQLGPLTVDTFGHTFYHMPLADSPLLNGGFNCPDRDQRLATRPDACDIGAVEFGGLLPMGYLPLAIR
jgi:predicted outer membrane repeat protein